MAIVKPHTKSKRKVLLSPGEDGYFMAEALANIEEEIDLCVEVLQAE